MSFTKIIIIKIGALGDVLETTPFLRQLRHEQPDAQIDYWVGSHFAHAVLGNTHLTRVMPFDPNIFFTRNLSQWLQLVRYIQRENYDCGYILDKHWIFPLTAFLARTHHRIGFHRDSASRLLLHHSIEFGPMKSRILSYLDLLNAPDYADCLEECPISQEAHAAAETTLRQYDIKRFYVWINSGGHNAGEASHVRRLPRETFEAMLNLLPRNETILLMGGREDFEFYNRCSLPAHSINLAGKTTFGEAMAILSLARKVFTTDCGAMHMAAAAGASSVVILGPTEPQRVLPPRANIHCLFHPGPDYSPRYTFDGTIPRGSRFYNTEPLVREYSDYVSRMS